MGLFQLSLVIPVLCAPAVVMPFVTTAPTSKRAKHMKVMLEEMPDASVVFGPVMRWVVVTGTEAKVWNCDSAAS